jgi:hypothetical protein
VSLSSDTLKATVQSLAITNGHQQNPSWPLHILPDILTAMTLLPEDGGSSILRNADRHLPGYIVLCGRRQDC